jgi:hypothetical protein
MVNMINIPATDVSSLIPFIFNIPTMAMSAMVKMMMNTRKTGARINPNRCFFQVQ